MKQTINLKLNKPGYSDVVDVEELNTNFDELDTIISKANADIKDINDNIQTISSKVETAQSEIISKICIKTWTTADMTTD